MLSLSSARLPAQETVRMSLAGEAAAKARRETESTPGLYNFRLGPTKWKVAAGLDVEANDNIRFEASDPKGDLVFHPQLISGMDWRVSDRNHLNLEFGAGYSVYTRHSEYDRFFITPGSSIGFDLYIGDLWIDLHERLSISENAYADPTVVGIGDYSQFQNTAGVSATWDLNKLILKIGYDHANYAILTGQAGVPDGSSENFGLSASYHAAPNWLIGTETGGGVLCYAGAGAPTTRATDWNVGAFTEFQPMQYVKLRGASGYTAYLPSGSAQEFTGVYGRVGVNHRLNKIVEYDLSGGRNISFGFFAGTVDLSNAVLEARWHLFQKLSVGTGFEFDHGSQALSGPETFDRFGPRLTLERGITARMSGTVRYQYYQRKSNVPRGDYALNLVVVSLVYRL